jgi:hypothetical protein
MRGKKTPLLWAHRGSGPSTSAFGVECARMAVPDKVSEISRMNHSGDCKTVIMTRLSIRNAEMGTSLHTLLKESHGPVA